MVSNSSFTSYKTQSKRLDRIPSICTFFMRCVLIIEMFDNCRMQNIHVIQLFVYVMFNSIYITDNTPQIIFSFVALSKLSPIPGVLCILFSLYVHLNLSAGNHIHVHVQQLSECRCCIQLPTVQ